MRINFAKYKKILIQELKIFFENNNYLNVYARETSVYFF